MSAAYQIEVSDECLTNHAICRMYGRGITLEMVELVLAYGRMVHTRGAEIFVVGRKEVEHFAESGVDLDAVDGLHVVCVGTTIVTVYRNHDLRGLRPRSRRRRQG